jgi:glycosyltransferase involved in cell wall biosynthesis
MLIQRKAKIRKNTNPGVLFLFPKPARREMHLIEDSKAPTERLYGMAELARDGYNVSACDARFTSPLRYFYNWLRGLGISCVAPLTLVRIARCDILVVKDNFNTLVSIAAKLFGTKLVYKDSLFTLPERRHKAFQISLNLRLADHVIGYSESQAALWRRAFPASADKLDSMTYPIDLDFYRQHMPRDVGDRVISVGRDIGRDYSTLVKANAAAGTTLHLITLPYLVPDNAVSADHIHLHQDIAYEKLFSLYKESFVAVVPLKSSFQYPAGIRAVMEAAAVGVPCICTDTPVLREYFTDKHEILYYQPGDTQELAHKIRLLYSDRELRRKLAQNAAERVQEYDIRKYARNFGSKYIHH